jgi:hypothetical protein
MFVVVAQATFMSPLLSFSFVLVHHYRKKGHCRSANLCREPLHGKDIFAVRSN